MVGFKEHLRAEVVPGEGVYLFSEKGVRLIDSRELELLAPLLNERRALPALLDAVGAQLPPERVGYLLRELSAASLVESGWPAAEAEAGQGAGLDRSALAFWELGGLDGRTAADRVARGRVRLTAVGGADPQAVARALERTGIEVCAPDAPPPDRPDAELSVVLCEDYLDPALAEVAVAHRAAGRAWLPARPSGATVWAGPVLRPDEGPCLACLTHRLWGQRDVEARVQHALGRTGPAAVRSSGIPASRELGAQLIALEAATWLAGHRHTVQEGLLALDCFSLETTRHAVRRRPQCPGCGDPGLIAAQGRRPVQPRSHPKTDAGAPGCAGDRAAAPHQVMERYGDLVSPVTGVVRAIEPDPAAPLGCHVQRAGFNLALTGAGPEQARRGLRSFSSGKGLTPEQARVSALCEALERYSGLFTGEEAVVRGSLRRLRALGRDVVHPNDCQLYDERQFAARAEWNRAHGVFQYVCEPLDEDAVLDWSPVWSMTAGRHRLLPSALLYFGGPNPPGRTFARADSNGCAAGSSLEDAIVQGFLELVERDAAALWWYNRTAQPGVDLDAFAPEWTASQRALHARLGRELWALDLTADLGVPVFAALSRRTDKPAEDIVIGLGAHFDPRTALRRAIAELGQMIPFVSGADSDGHGYDCTDPDLLEWCRTATVAENRYLLPADGVARTRPEDHPYTPRADLLDDVNEIVRLSAAHGLEVLVLDQTRPDLGLPVVRVLVPGLRHFWARFAPGRLYDVPVTLGRLAAPTRYEDLNPMPIFF